MQEYEVAKAVQMVHERLRAMHTLELSHDEAYRLIADAETRDLLTRAKPIMKANPARFAPCEWMRSNGHLLRLTFHFLGSNTPLLPRDVVIQNEPELIARVNDWLDKTIEVDIACSRLSMVNKMLHRLCGNYRQIRYLFPGILPLLDIAGLSDTASKVRKPPTNPPVGTPTLAPLEREHVRRANVTVNMALLLPDPEPLNPGAKTVSIGLPSPFKANLPEGSVVDVITP